MLIALCRDYFKIAEALIKEGAKLDVKANGKTAGEQWDKATPLMIAVKKKFEDVAVAAVEHGAKTDVTDSVRGAKGGGWWRSVRECCLVQQG